MSPLVSLAVALLLSAATAYGQQTNAGQAIQQGTAAMRAGKPAEAVIAFKRAVAADPQSPDAHLDLGMAHLRAGDADQAAIALTRALELNPSLHGAHLFLGIAEYQRNNLAAAAIALHAELAAAPKNVEALTWLGIVELASDHPEQAAAALDQAATLTPSDPNVLSLVGKAHGQIAQKAYRALYKLDPDSWQVHRALAENYSASGEFEKAIGEYQAAIAKQPNNPDLYESLGEENQKMSRGRKSRRAGAPLESPQRHRTLQPGQDGR
jgi:tetratricopeptide (TPR) repeat protein